MSNELVKRDNTPHGPVVAFKDFDGMYKFASMMVKSGKLPKDVNPETAVMMIMYGQELGLPPMKSLLETFDSIAGKLALKPAMMNSMIRQAGHTITIDKWEADECIITGIRKDTGTKFSIRYTIKDAEKAGLISKDNYKKNPKNMLFARAMGNLGRMLFADVIGNMYDSDEFPEQFNAEQEPMNEIEAEVHTIQPHEPQKPELQIIPPDKLYERVRDMGYDVTLAEVLGFVEVTASMQERTHQEVICSALKNQIRTEEFAKALMHRRPTKEEPIDIIEA
jgi:hypothetical protein